MNFVCKYCSSERKSNNSLTNHERTCPANLNRNYKNGMTGKAGKNQYTKALELDIEKPKVSVETRKKLSEKAKIAHKFRSKSTNEKISISMKKAHAEGRAWNIGKSRWNNDPSYPEKFFINVIENEFLDKDYIKEFPVGIYSADFCWKHLKKIIEIDGEQHYRFEEYLQRDLRKDKFLIVSGYRVLRISWKEMYHNTKREIKKCYDFIHY